MKRKAGMSKRNWHGRWSVAESVAEAILVIAQYTARHGEIATVFGPANIGKSFAVASVEGQMRLGRPIVLRIRKGVHTQAGILRALCEKAGLPSGGRLCDVWDRLLGYLSETKRSLIFDDCDCLTANAVEVVRDLYDQLDCAVLFVGNRNIGKARGMSEQFVTRIAWMKELRPAPGSRLLSKPKDVRDLLYRGDLRLVTE